MAAPGLGDPNFERSVVLLIEHSDEGALGLILNRPSDIDVVDPLPEWEPLTGQPPVVFFGGPVSQGGVLALGRAREGEGEGFSPVVGDIGVVDLHQEPDQVAAAVDRLRVFSGYAGWSGGQLESELEEGGWFLLDAAPDDALSDSPDSLWSDVLRRQGGRLARYANYPVDVSAN